MLCAAGDVLVVAPQLSQAEVVILSKKSSQSSVKTSSDVGVKTILLQEGDSSKMAPIDTGLGDK